MSILDRANIDQFYFFCGLSARANFSVRQFSGREEISHITRFTITLTSPSADIDLEQLINAPGIFLMHHHGEFHPFTGLVTHARYCGTNQFYSSYEITLQSELFVLTCTQRSRIFQKKTTPEIITTVLDDNGITDYETTLSADYPVKEYVVQYNESDFSFISRLMEEAGIWYFSCAAPVLAEEIGSGDIIVPLRFTDDPSAFEELPSNSRIPFRYRSGLARNNDSGHEGYIYSCESGRVTLPGEVTVKSYNYRTPEIDLTDSRTVPQGHYGLHYEYGGDFRTTEEAAAAAETEAKRIAIRASSLRGKSFHRGLRAGYRITIVEHEREEISATWVLTAIEHKGRAAESVKAFEMPSYTNSFEALPDTAANTYTPQKVTPPVKIPGIINATVDALGTDYATLDEYGRYRIRLPFDIEATEACKASKPVRMSQTYSGAAYGMHFPLHKEVEILLGHVADNPDKPLGIASVPNANTVSPVTSSNKESSVLRTAGKNEITLTDTEGREQMSFSAPESLSLIADGSQTISIGNNRSVSVKKNETKVVDGNQTLDVSGNCTESVKVNNGDTVSGNSDLTVTGDLEETFQNTLDRTTGGDSTETITGDRSTSVTLSNSEKFSADHTIDVSGDLAHSTKTLSTFKTSADMSVKAGAMAGAQSLTITIQGTASVKLQVGGNTIELTPGSIEINSPATTTIAGSLITTIGGIISISGLPVNIN